MTLRCPRCGADLCTRKNFFGLIKHHGSVCPSCGINCVFLGGKEVWVVVGEFTTPIEMAEEVAKQQGIEWPEWPEWPKKEPHKEP